jgi:uncharacterized protein
MTVRETFSVVSRCTKYPMLMTKNSSALNSNRIEFIDMLRGFTLLGIILVHMVEQYYAGPWPEKLGNPMSNSIADGIVTAFVGIFIIGKFYMIFSFLFGLSFYIQFSKSDSEKNFLLRFTWRLVVLFVVGFIHHLHYRGDILTIYALLGLFLIVLHRLPNRYLLWAAGLLILNVPLVIWRLVELFTGASLGNPFTNLDQDELMTYHNAVKSGSYADILNANLHSFAGKMEFQLWSGRIFITLGLFLLGIYAGRKNFFRDLNEKIPLLKSFRRYAWIILGLLILSGGLIAGVSALFKFEISSGVQMLLGGAMYDIFNASLATIYVVWISLWLQKEKWRKRLHILYPVGRMGLTTYLMQTVFGTIIFFSYGLALLGDIGGLVSFVLAVVLFVVQIVFANYWFRYFSFGPVEWVWRSLTYLKIQPIKPVQDRLIESQG